MKRKSAKAALTMVCMLLGVMIGIQFKTVQRQGNVFDLQRVSELSVELKKAIEENQVLKDKLEEYENTLTNEGNSYKILKDEMDNIKMLAGMTDMEGRGISVTLDDSSKTADVGDNIDSNVFLVHAEDILTVINELNVAGAEAVSINGERIVGTSSVRCTGPVVSINGVKVAAPFVVNAIGDPDVLEAALRFPGGVVDSLSPWGIQVTIKKMANVVVPGYKNTLKFNEASPVESKSDGKK